MGGDPPAQSANETTAQQMIAMKNHYPGLMAVINSQIMPNELAQLESSKITSPAYAELQDQIYKTFGISLNDTGNRIADTNAQASAKRDLDTLNTYGKDVAQASLDAARVADPEYYNTRAALGKQYADLLGNGANLSGGEIAQITRGANAMDLATGNSGINSATNTAAKLATFGKAASDKLNTAIQLVQTGLPALKSGVDTNLITTGKSAVPNSGDAKFMGATQGAGSQAVGLGNSFLQQTGENARQTNTINANRRSGLDRTLGAVSSITGSVGNLFSPIKIF